ncbi:MAG: hypothetical protein ABFS12_03420 [Bacteroidota bacterium]
MDFDIFLTQICQNDEAFFRLYRWEPYAISLGTNQDFKDIDIAKAREDNIDVVKRPTGGRAILHSEELTYSLILPVEFGLTAREVYNKTSVALSKGLGLYNDMLKSTELETIQPNFREQLAEKSGSLCFASTAKSEVKYLGKKLIGSAQRKMNRTILQHGSILCGRYHNNLPHYLYDDSSIQSLIEELDNKTTEISTITNESVDYLELSQSIINGFESEWDINLRQSSNSIESEFEKSNQYLQEA